jgi:histidine ammonia-lyase
VVAAIRAHVPRLVADRPPAPDIERIARLIEDGAVVKACVLPLA